MKKKESMKTAIFNKYVEHVCKGTGVSKKQLFKKNRSIKFSTARYLLYAMCYQRPMSILQIAELMADNGYRTARQNIEYGLDKIFKSEDVDIVNFLRSANESSELNS
jgi:hypothetical protein